MSIRLLCHLYLQLIMEELRLDASNHASAVLSETGDLRRKKRCSAATQTLCTLLSSRKPHERPSFQRNPTHTVCWLKSLQHQCPNRHFPTQRRRRCRKQPI